MNRLIQLFCAALLLVGCNQSGFKEVQLVEKMYVLYTPNGKEAINTDTTVFFVSADYIIEKTFASSYSVSGNHYEVTTTYPGIAGDQTPITTYSYDEDPELAGKIQTGWNVFRTVSDSFCLFIDSSFKVSKKSMKALPSHVDLSLNKIDFSKYRRLPNKKLPGSQYLEVYVGVERQGEAYDSTILFFDSKMNNRLVGAPDYPGGNHFVRIQSFNNIQQGNSIVSNKEIDFSFKEKHISGSDEKLARKLIKLYQENY